VGDVRRVVMGLDKNTLTPCGFCFVVYYTRGDTEACVNILGGSVLDERPIRVDVDWGFQEGRQYGRGKSGGQVRDEYRTDYDAGRGGYGKIVLSELDSQQQGSGSRGYDGHSNKRRNRDDDDGGESPFPRVQTGPPPTREAGVCTALLRACTQPAQPSACGHARTRVLSLGTKITRLASDGGVGTRTVVSE